MTPIAPLLTLLVALATSPAAARPAPGPPPILQPDEPASAFIERWNEWCQETDPDQQLRKDFQSAIEAIRAEYVAVLGQYRADPSLEDLTNARDWRATQAYAERIAPHTARIRELAARPHLAFPFPSPEDAAVQRAEVAEWEATWGATEQTNPQEPNTVQWERPPLPTSTLETFFIMSDMAYEVYNAATRLRDEIAYALHIGNLGLTNQNIIAQLDLARLISERPGLNDTLFASMLEGQVTRGITQLLHRHPRRLRENTLESLQTALLGHAQRRTRLLIARRFDDRVYAELLPTWFDPDQPDRLTKRGQAYVDAGSTASYLDHQRRFVLDSFPPMDQSFAPAAEQARVVNAISEAFARDAATPWHSREGLESSRLFRQLADADPDARLAPALMRFTVHNAILYLDLSAEIDLRAALTLLGVHRHRAITGAWPETLADIDPDVMRFDPIDPHSGQPFGYAVIDDQPTLWSAGPDRDNDDGRPIPEPPDPPEGEFPQVPSLRWFTLNEWAALPPEVQAEYDGDIVLFPPTDR